MNEINFTTKPPGAPIGTALLPRALGPDKFCCFFLSHGLIFFLDLSDSGSDLGVDVMEEKLEVLGVKLIDSSGKLNSSGEVEGRIFWD